MDQLWRSFGKVVLLVVVLVPVLVAVYAVLATRRKKRGVPAPTVRRTALLDVLVAAALLPAVYLVAVPVDVPYRSAVDLLPGSGIVRLFDSGTSGETARWQGLGNVLMFAPLGALLPIRFPLWRSWTGLLLSFLVGTAMIEAGQYLLSIGRVIATDEVILTSLGGLLGAALTCRWWNSSAGEAASRETQAGVSS